MTKPIIGLLPLYDREKDSYWMLPGYLRGVEKAGGIPLILPPRADQSGVSALLDRLDGLLFTGGQDVDPAIYGQKPEEGCDALCPERDRLETAVLPLAMERDLPVLGICRGLQLINAALGGTLWQDLPSQRPDGIPHRVNGTENDLAHSVTLMPGTPLAELLKTGTLEVNSHHHQAIRALSSRLQPMAVSPDGLVEAAYRPGSRFFWGVQWHPEMTLDSSPASRAIFAAFIRACDGKAPSADGEGLGFYGSGVDVVTKQNVWPSIRTPRDLYRALLHCWSAATCAGRMRSHWSPDNPTLGQCSITAFLAQDLFGGRVWGVPLPNGFFHCYNEVDGRVFDLTSEQFGGETLCYEHNPEQLRAVHFAMPEKQERYELLKAALERYLKS